MLLYLVFCIATIITAIISAKNYMNSIVSKNNEDPVETDNALRREKNAKKFLIFFVIATAIVVLFQKLSFLLIIANIIATLVTIVITIFIINVINKKTK